MSLFGPIHIAILATIIVSAIILVCLARRSAVTARHIRLAFGAGLAVNEVAWYAFRYSREGFRFPEGLPLQLCDVTLWLTVIACLRLSAVAAELVYFVGLGGAVMALITPDLWSPLLSYPTLYFFFAHGGVVVAIIVVVFGRLVTLKPRSLWRAFAVLNVYVAGIGVFDAVFSTNYMYLCKKPASASLLDLFGPWPMYIVIGDVFALGLFALMALPLRHVGAGHATIATRREDTSLRRRTAASH